MRTITVVCQPYYPDETSTSQLLTVLLEDLASADVNITVLCGFPSQEKGKPPRVPRTETKNGVSIHRCGLRIDHKRHLLNRAISYVCYLLHLFLLLIIRRRPDVLFGVTNPPFNAQVMWLASCLRSLDYQYMLQDIMPEGFIAVNDIRPGSLVARVWLATNGWAYRRARQLVVLGRDMIPLLVKTYGVDESKCVYIPHWSPFSSEAPKPLIESSMCRRLGLTDKFIVQYSGNMGFWHDMKIFVRAAEELQNDDRIHFLFVGGGRRRAEAEQLSRELKLSNITWHDFVPLEELDDNLACCHASLISLRSGLEGIAVPCKLYGILASGRYVIAQVPANSEVALTVEENDCGIVVPPGNLVDLVTAIRQAVDAETTVWEKGRRARQAYNKKYLLKNGVDAFRQLWRC